MYVIMEQTYIDGKLLIKQYILYALLLCDNILSLYFICTEFPLFIVSYLLYLVFYFIAQTLPLTCFCDNLYTCTIKSLYY